MHWPLFVYDKIGHKIRSINIAKHQLQLHDQFESLHAILYNIGELAQMYRTNFKLNL